VIQTPGSQQADPRIGTVRVLIRIGLVTAYPDGMGIAYRWARAWGQTPAPLISIGLDQAADEGNVAMVMQLFLLMTVLSLAPSILIMLTSFTRIAIVFSLLRQAMGTNQLPPNQVVIGLSLFLTFYVMAPVWQQVNQDALQPLIAKEINQQQALEKALVPIRTFMICADPRKGSGPAGQCGQDAASGQRGRGSYHGADSFFHHQ
jgi:flagellar biosynthesis protein FliP